MKSSPIDRNQWALPLVLLAAILIIAAFWLIGRGSAGIESGVYVVRTEGGAPGWIGGPAGIPVWSPMRDSVAWGSEDGLFLATPDDQIATTLVSAPVVGNPAWSPDGKSIAFVDRDRASLVVVDVDAGRVQFAEPIAGGSTVAAPSSLVTLGGPSWAPDGSQMAFVCADTAGDEVCVVQADGTGRRQVTQLHPLEPASASSAAAFTRAASNTGPPAWSPDGSFLAVAAYPEQRGAARGVFIVDLVGGTARRVSEVQPNSIIGWFPDGESVYFSAVQRGRSDVVRVSVGDSVAWNLTEGLPAGARTPALSSDGARLAVESNGAVVILSQQNQPQELVATGLRATYPAWSSDDVTIAFSADLNPIATYN